MSAKATRPSSSDSSDSSDTSSPPDSSSYSSSSSSSSAPSTPRDGGTGGRAAAPFTAAVPSSSNDTAGNICTSTWRVQLNPNLQFARTDNAYIPLPDITAAQVHTVLERLTSDKVAYPERHYRTLDYFRAAVEMFVDTVRAEYKRQQQSAAKRGTNLTKFTWMNSGELAVCFVCCCDYQKLLHGKLAPGPFKPTVNDFALQMKRLLMSLSGVPQRVLDLKTYNTKYHDWEKGGTRYRDAQATANVRFPSAEDRSRRIEAYLRSSAGLAIGTTRVAPGMPVVAAPAAAATAAAAPSPPPGGGGASVKSAPVAPFVAPFRPAKGPGPVLHTGTAVPPRAPISVKAVKGRQPPAHTAGKQMPEPLRHLHWLSSLAHVKGGEPGAAFPLGRLAALPGLVRLCEGTVQPQEITVLVDVMAASCEAVQDAFERLGGLVAFRRLLGRVVKQSATEGARDTMRFIERVVQLRAHRWGCASQRAWRTNLAGQLTEDLGWLRALPFIPVDRRAAWGALVLVMEEKFIFRAPREEAEESRKRSRLEAAADGGDGGAGGDTGGAGSGGGASTPHMDAMRAAVADNLSIQQWKLPRVYTLGAVRLPAELRAPPLASEVEQVMVDFINKRRRFAEETQVEWQARLRAMLRVSAPDMAASTVIPLWYDPFQLLGITPSE